MLLKRSHAPPLFLAPPHLAVDTHLWAFSDLKGCSSGVWDLLCSDVACGGGAGVGVLYSEVLGVTLDAYVAYAVCIRMHLTWYAAGELCWSLLF